MVDQELIDRYDAAWNEQDVDAIMAFHPDDVVFHNHNAGECVEGAAAMREHVAGIFATYPDLRFRRRRLYVGPGASRPASGRRARRCPTGAASSGTASTSSRCATA